MEVSFGFIVLLSIFMLSVQVVKPENDAQINADEESEVKNNGVVEEEDVLVLTGDNFDEVIADKDIILVEFYAPWCGHCKSLAPEYAKAAKELKAVKYPVALGKVDATEHKELAERFSVSGYPTLKIFKNGQSMDYEGPRDKAGIVKYMEERGDPTWQPPPEAVLTLVSDNFTQFIDAHDLSLVEFYAPWCGHCKQLAPEYEKAAQMLKELNIPLAKVDATEEKDLGTKYDVTGFPTMKVFRRGKAYEYKGGRDKFGIVEYMKKQDGDAAKLVDSLKSLRGIMPKDDITVVGFFTSDQDQVYKLYQEAANEMREDYTLMYTFDKDVRKHYKINVGSVVVFLPERFYTKFEPKWNVMEIEDKTEISSISEFVKKHEIPLVGHYQQSNKDTRYKRRPLVLFFFTVDFGFDGVKATQIWRTKIADIAKGKNYRGLTFAIVDDESMSVDAKDFGFDDSGEEMNIGILDEKNRKFPMPPMEEFNEEDIVEFLDLFVKGKLKPKVKSQPIPKKQKGPVTVVVGKNFNDIVLDETKDVLIEFYAPWCGHCKKLEPTLKDLAKKFKKEKSLTIAKMDATANDAPSQFEVSGFPTIYFAPAKSKDHPIKFESSNRELEDFEKFIKEHATLSLGKIHKQEL